MKSTPMNTAALSHAALHLLESLGYSALITALIAITQYTANHDHIDYMQLLLFVLPQVALCLSLSVAEYLKTIGQAQIGTLVQTETQLVASKNNMALPDIASFAASTSEAVQVSSVATIPPVSKQSV